MINVSMLAIKCIYACYQTNICLLSKMRMLAIKRTFAYCQKCVCLHRDDIFFIEYKHLSLRPSRYDFLYLVEFVECLNWG